MNSLVFRPSSIIGLKEEDAKRVIEKNNLFWRITKRDDQWLLKTNTVKNDRVSMHIEGDEVTDAYIG